MKLAKIKRFLYIFIALCGINASISYADTKKPEPLEKVASETDKLLRSKCLQETHADTFKKIVDSIIEWGNAFVDLKNPASKSTSLVGLKSCGDRLHALTSDLDAVFKQNENKELKKERARVLVLLRALHHNIMKIYEIIRQYEGGSNVVYLGKLGIDLSPYQPALPEIFRKMKQFDVMTALKHRFSCKDVA